MGIQINGNTNNINAGIGSLSIEDINELDIVGVATAANFKTGVSNLHNVGLTLSGGQIDVGSNIKLGNAGVITATSFVGDGSNLTSLPAQATISNNADDRVITGGSGVNLNGEQRLTFNSSNILTATETGTGNGVGGIRAATANAGGNAGYGFMTNSANRFAVTTIGSAGAESLRVYDDNNNAERLRIDSDGQIGIGNIAPDTWSTGKSITIGTSQATLWGVGDQVNLSGNAYFNSSWKAVATKAGASQIQQALGNIDFRVSGSVTADAAITWINALRITSDGQLLHTANKSSGYTARFVQANSSNPAWIEIDSPADNNLRPAYIQLQNAGTNKWGIGQVYQSTSSGAFHIAAGAQNQANSKLTITTAGLIGINNNNPTHPLHIVNTSSTFNSASLIRGDTSTSGGGAYATFTNTANSKSAYFGVDGNGLFNLDAGAALVGTNGDESIIFATNGNDEKVRIFGGTDNVLQMGGGSKLSISDYAPYLNFSGSYAGLHHDNHGNTLLALNASLNYSGTSGTHQWKQNNAHSSIGCAGMFIGGNGSNNNTDICFFHNSQGNSAGQVFAQDSWRFRIGSSIIQNYNIKYTNRGYFYTQTSSQTATNSPSLAGTLSYGFGYQEAYSTSGGTWLHPYPDLVLGYHTGISFGGYRSYGGCRFFQDHPSGNTSTVLEVGNGSTGVHVTNSFTAGSNKGFRIAHPHPSKKYTHDLVHNAIEAPQMDLIYRGKIDLVNGSATVNIDIKAGMTDGTFVLLNRDIQCFTSNETGWTAVKGSVSGNILTITAQDNSCTDTISWMVVGERQDDKIKESELTTDDGDLITEPLTIEATHM